MGNYYKNKLLLTVFWRQKSRLIILNIIVITIGFLFINLLLLINMSIKEGIKIDVDKKTQNYNISIKSETGSPFFLEEKHLQNQDVESKLLINKSITKIKTPNIQDTDVFLYKDDSESLLKNYNLHKDEVIVSEKIADKFNLKIDTPICLNKTAEIMNIKNSCEFDEVQITVKGIEKSSKFVGYSKSWILMVNETNSWTNVLLKTEDSTLNQKIEQLNANLPETVKAYKTQNDGDILNNDLFFLYRSLDILCTVVFLFVLILVFGFFQNLSNENKKNVLVQTRLGISEKDTKFALQLFQWLMITISFIISVLISFIISNSFPWIPQIFWSSSATAIQYRFNLIGVATFSIVYFLFIMISEFTLYASKKKFKKVFHAKILMLFGAAILLLILLFISRCYLIVFLLYILLVIISVYLLIQIVKRLFKEIFYFSKIILSKNITRVMIKILLVFSLLFIIYNFFIIINSYAVMNQKYYTSKYTSDYIIYADSKEKHLIEDDYKKIGESKSKYIDDTSKKVKYIVSAFDDETTQRLYGKKVAASEVLVSSQLRKQLDLEKSDFITLPTDKGYKTYKISGVISGIQYDGKEVILNSNDFTEGYEHFNYQIFVNNQNPKLSQDELEKKTSKKLVRSSDVIDESTSFTQVIQTAYNFLFVLVMIFSGILLSFLFNQDLEVVKKEINILKKLGWSKRRLLHNNIMFFLYQIGISLLMFFFAEIIFGENIFRIIQNEFYITSVYTLDIIYYICILISTLILISILSTIKGIKRMYND